MNLIQELNSKDGHVTPRKSQCPFLTHASNTRECSLALSHEVVG